MATDDFVPAPGNGRKTGPVRRHSRVFSSSINSSAASERPRGEFSKLQHYVGQMRGLLLDTQA